MHLHFLGNGSAFNPCAGNTSAYIKENDRLFLLDCGETVFSRIIEKDLLNGVRSVFVAVSHTHSDHFGSLGSLIAYCWFMLGFKVSVVVPDDADGAYRNHLKCLLDGLGVGDDNYTFMPASGITGFSSFDAFSYVPTTHDPGMLCHSFAFETENGGVFYSADTSTVRELTHFLEVHPAPEAIYMETSAVDSPGSIHLNMYKLAEAVPEALRAKIFLMHFRNNSCIEKARDLGFGITSVD